jgi:hypothetical protein
VFVPCLFCVYLVFVWCLLHVCTERFGDKKNFSLKTSTATNSVAYVYIVGMHKNKYSSVHFTVCISNRTRAEIMVHRLWPCVAGILF